MNFLTKRIGRFPVGIWIVLIILVITGLIFTLFAQVLSFFAWETALLLGLQEDSFDSPDILERTVAAISWAEAGADIIVQGALIILTLIGIFRQRPFGFVMGMIQATIWIYVSIMIPLQRIAFYKWGIVFDLSRFWDIGPILIILAGIPGIIMIFCLAANRQFFKINQSG